MVPLRIAMARAESFPGNLINRRSGDGSRDRSRRGHAAASIEEAAAQRRAAAILKRWIEQGAEYQRHWSFEPPKKVPVPREASHPIDHFIEASSRNAGLAPSPLASPTTLIRRVALDLTGLPPTPAEVDAFVTASAKDADAAYRELVDRLLASPHYGERWGRYWLDQARYADSNGYTIDAPRQIWKYRDWVIDALNADMPFDQFTIEQLAGDLLPERDREPEDRHRLSPQHADQPGRRHRPGAVPRRSVVDRVATTGTVWLGLTRRLRPVPRPQVRSRSRRRSTTSSSPSSTIRTSRR